MKLHASRSLLCVSTSILFIMLACAPARIEPETGVYDILWKEDYVARFIPLLTRLAKVKGEWGVSEFYISKLKTDQAGNRWVWIYWRRMEHLILFNADVYTYNLEECRWYYELKKGIGVVSTEEEVGSSEWLMSRAEAQRQIEDCKKGTKLVVNVKRAITLF